MNVRIVSTYLTQRNEREERLNHSSLHLKKVPHHCNENKFFSTVSSRGKKRIKISDIRTDGRRKVLDFSNYELAVFKNVVIQTKASLMYKTKSGKSKPISFHKIAGAFHISSRTVHTWMSKIYAISKVLIHVNIKQVAHSFLNHILAYRNGWITEIHIDDILSGVEIH